MISGNHFTFWLGVAAVAALIVAGVQINNLQADNRLLAKDLQTQTQARNTAEWLLDGQEQVMSVFAAIRTANRAARLNDEIQRDETKQKINEATTHEYCGDRVVPAAAADELLRLENYTRTLSGFTTAD